jgi:hypothetical protein
MPESEIVVFSDDLNEPEYSRHYDYIRRSPMNQQLALFTRGPDSEYSRQCRGFAAAAAAVGINIVNGYSINNRFTVEVLNWIGKLFSGQISKDHAKFTNQGHENDCW